MKSNPNHNQKCQIKYCFISTQFNSEFLNKAPQIDCLIFLDSDDYWEENLLEECLKVSSGVDIVWFSSERIINGKKVEQKQKSDLALYYYEKILDSTPNFTHTSKAPIITSQQWLEISKVHKLPFYFAWNGMIDFNFLCEIKLYFIDRIRVQDAFFGLMLFAQAKRIYMLDKRLYNYCMNPQSTSNYDKNIKKENIPIYLKEIYEAFGDAFETKNYFSHWSMLFGTATLIDFIQANPHNKNIQALKNFLPYFLLPMCIGFQIKDPWHTYDLLDKITKYITENKFIKWLYGIIITHKKGKIMANNEMQNEGMKNKELINKLKKKCRARQRSL